ncbi:hypothetical protein MJ1HA_1288 [Metallosphaera sedula]|nr:hypothetical protein MJ1HA_1288 [Metallosphaera sedula]
MKLFVFFNTSTIFSPTYILFSSYDHQFLSQVMKSLQQLGT